MKTGDSVNNFQAFARYRGLLTWMRWVPGACAPGFMLTPASQAKNLEARLFGQSRLNSKLHHYHAQVKVDHFNADKLVFRSPNREINY